MNILKDWSSEHTQKFQKETFTFRHRINETNLFTDEALLTLLGTHPSHLMDVCSMSEENDPTNPNRFLTGDFRDASPETILAAAKAGRIWINLRKAMNIHPKYKVLLSKMYGEIAHNTKKKAYKANGGILISSPISQTPYHFDKTETILWHVRGKKRVYVYPLTQKFISDKAFEDTIIKSITDDIPYSTEFEKDAIIIDLEDDQAATWPLNSPHRVDNSEFCVSITTEYTTHASSLKNAGMIANATLRDKFGISSNWSEEKPPTKVAKFVLGKVIKATTTLQDKNVETDMVSFKLDPSVPGFIVETEPYPRQF